MGVGERGREAGTVKAATSGEKRGFICRQGLPIILEG